MSADWRSRHLRFLAADLRLFSFSRDFDTAFAAAVIAPAATVQQEIRTYAQRKETAKEKIRQKLGEEVIARQRISRLYGK